MVHTLHYIALGLCSTYCLYPCLCLVAAAIISVAWLNTLPEAKEYPGFWDKECVINISCIITLNVTFKTVIWVRALGANRGRVDYLWRPGSIITNFGLVVIIVIVAINIIIIPIKYDNSDQIQIMSFCATEAEEGGMGYLWRLFN